MQGIDFIQEKEELMEKLLKEKVPVEILFEKEVPVEKVSKKEEGIEDRSGGLGTPILQVTSMGC